MPVKPAPAPKKIAPSLSTPLKPRASSDACSPREPDGAEKVQRWMHAVGGRRFILTVGAGVICSFLLHKGALTPEIYRDLILGTVGIYVAGNTAQKIQTIRSDSNHSSEDSDK